MRCNGFVSGIMPIVLGIVLSAAPMAASGSGLRVTGPERDPALNAPLDGAPNIRVPAGTPAPGDVPNTVISLNDRTRTASDGRSTWTETMLETVPTSNQELVDTIIGEDGNLYCAYFDDLPIPSQPAYKAIFVKRSTDGGATWGNPDAGSNGFALFGIFMDRPSIVVFPTNATTYRLAVAVSAPYPNQSSANDIVVCWKDIGTTDDFTLVSVQNDTSDDYIGPRLKSVRRPGQPALRRIVCASYSATNGRLFCDYTDTNVTSWESYSAINYATDQVLFWRADFMEDVDNSRLFCSWSVDVSGTAGDHPRVIIALSTNQGQSWFSTLYAISPSGWDYCAESDAAIASNPSQTGKTLMTVWSASQTAGSSFKICYSYQLLNAITVAGTTWSMGTVTYGTVYSDTDGDNTMPAIVEDNRYPDGGYRVAFIDQFAAASAQVRYTECTFSTPVAWTWPEVVSAPGADPARNGSDAISSGVGYASQGAYQNRRAAIWPDYRSGEFEIYAAWSEFTPSFDTPTPAQSPTPTSTRTPTVTQTPTAPPFPTDTPTPSPSPTQSSTPTPSLNTPTPTGTPPLQVPALGVSGFLILLAAVSLLLLTARFRRD